VSDPAVFNQEGLVVGEDDLGNPTQLVLYASMAPHGLPRPRRRERH